MKHCLSLLQLTLLQLLEVHRAEFLQVLLLLLLLLCWCCSKGSEEGVRSRCWRSADATFCALPSSC
jgi:hypothetical protein